VSASRPTPTARLALDVAAVVIVLAGVLVLRGLTQSTHRAMPADSRLRVVVEPVSNRSEPSQALTAVAWAQLAACDLEVAGAIEGEPEVLGQDPLLVEVVFAPALDATDRKQFAGCVEDWAIDNHLLHIHAMEEYREP
jgi:hypothetical protein